MIKTATYILSALLAAGAAWAQSPSGVPAFPSGPASNVPASNVLVSNAPPPNAQAPVVPVIALSSADKVREAPGPQYVLLKMVVARSIGIVKTRALPVESGGYNLLKYCWTPANVLGDWGEGSGQVGEMVVRALETLSWARDLQRAGYPEAPVAEAIGRYEAALIAAGFANAAHTRAFDAFRSELDGLRLRTPGAADINARYHCNRQGSSFGLNFKTLPEGGRVRFMPYVLHQFCLAQQIDPGDAVRCNYWLTGKDAPMSFAGETVYSVSWPDGTMTTGRFDPDEHRATGTVPLRERPQKK